MTVKVGISYTSVGNARQNRLAGARTLTFDEARKSRRANGKRCWGASASRQTAGRTKVKFYTGLYLALLGAASATPGDYPKHDGTVGHLPTKEGASGLQPLQYRRHVGRTVGTDAALGDGLSRPHERLYQQPPAGLQGLWLAGRRTGLQPASASRAWAIS